MKGCMDGFHVMSCKFITWPLGNFFSGAPEMGVWDMVSLVFLEDDGKAYAKTDKRIGQRIFVGDK